MPSYVIRRIRIAHCKRGPDRCEACRVLDTEKVCLVDVCPPQKGEIQRRLIKLVRDGEESWHEFDIVKVFEDQEEARLFAAEHAVEDIEL